MQELQELQAPRRARPGDGGAAWSAAAVIRVACAQRAANGADHIRRGWSFVLCGHDLWRRLLGRLN